MARAVPGRCGRLVGVQELLKKDVGVVKQVEVVVEFARFIVLLFFFRKVLNGNLRKSTLAVPEPSTVGGSSRRQKRARPSSRRRRRGETVEPIQTTWKPRRRTMRTRRSNLDKLRRRRQV